MKFEIGKPELYAAGETFLRVMWYSLLALSIISIVWLFLPHEKIKTAISEWASGNQPTIAVINVNEILTEKSNALKERLINARNNEERIAIHNELNQHGDMLTIWLNQRVPTLCGNNCIVLDERLVIRGAQIDLTPIFKEELEAQEKFHQEMSAVQQDVNANKANRN